MDKWKKRAIDLITSIALGSRDDPSVMPYYPQKTRIGNAEEGFFRRGTPERHGISSLRIYNMLCELEGDRRANIHSLMVLCGDEVISECSAGGYSTSEWHISHSMAKTVCGMVIGTLIDEGRLCIDEKIVDIFPEMPFKDRRFSQITVEHLLTMTSGVDFAEAGAITESEWTKTFFSSSVKFTPGSKFAYNSMNTYILARIAERVGEDDFGRLAEARIFAPLGIKSYLWEKGPEGTEKAGWGLYMSPESWAKLGYMFLNGGVFMGRRILSEGWVQNSSTTKVITPKVNGAFNYAYQIWTGRSSEEVLFNGMLGQNVWICPKNNIIVVMTGGNNEIFQASPSLEIIKKHLGGRIDDPIEKRNLKLLREKEALFFECRRWVRPKEMGRGIFCWLGVKPRMPYDTAWDPVLGEYAFGINNVGVMPLIVRAMQNALESCLELIKLEREGDGLCLGFRENGINYRLRIGLYGYKTNILDMRGEKYLVRAVGEAFVANRGEIEYRIELVFPETASVRRIRIIRTERDRITVEFSETPNNRLVENLMERFSETSTAISFAVDLIERRLGEGIVKKRLKKAFAPRLIGADTAFCGYEKIVEEETRRTLDESNTVRLIRAVVDRFFAENGQSGSHSETKGEGLINTKKSITKIIDKISGKDNKRGKNAN